MAAKDPHAQIKELTARLSACETRFVRMNAELGKAIKSLNEASDQGSLAKTELYRTKVEEFKKDLGAGAKEVLAAREAFDELRADKHVFKDHFKALDALATRLDKIDKLYQERIDEVEDLLQKVGVDILRMRRSNNRLELEQSALMAEVGDFQKGLQSMERALGDLDQQADRAVKDRDVKGMERAVRQVKGLGIDQASAKLQKLDMRLTDLEAQTKGLNNFPGQGDRERMRRSIREFGPSLDKLKDMAADLSDLEVPEVDTQAAAKALGLTDAKEIKDLKDILSGPDIQRSLEPLARKHDTNAKAWMKLLEKARLL